MPKAFTLIELLVVISIVTVLLALLLPALGKSRDSAKSIQCQANVRSIVQGCLFYSTDNDGYYPVSYYYAEQVIDNTQETPAIPVNGIVHWSNFLWGTDRSVGKSLACPMFSKGGLPPVNTEITNLESGQASWLPGVTDQQVSRCAYTLNEALCPGNRMVLGYNNVITASQKVKETSVVNPNQTILATELCQDWRKVHRAGSNNLYCESYVPVHGYSGMGPMSVPDRSDLNYIGNPHKCFGDYRKLEVADLSTDPDFNAGHHLDWVGRNHGSWLFWSRRSTFGYADGHVESKTLQETLSPFEWGQECYSIKGRKIEP